MREPISIAEIIISLAAIGFLIIVLKARYNDLYGRKK